MCVCVCVCVGMYMCMCVCWYVYVYVYVCVLVSVNTQTLSSHTYTNRPYHMHGNEMNLSRSEASEASDWVVNVDKKEKEATRGSHTSHGIGILCVYLITHYTCTHIHTHTYTLTHIHIHIHTHSQTVRQNRSQGGKKLTWCSLVCTQSNSMMMQIATMALLSSTVGGGEAVVCVCVSLCVAFFNSGGRRSSDVCVCESICVYVCVYVCAWPS
jgi:hypothetical protein